MPKILTDEEFTKYEKAFWLLKTVSDDYEQYGEVLQDETISEIARYFLEIDKGCESGKVWEIK